MTARKKRRLSYRGKRIIFSIILILTFIVTFMEIRLKPVVESVAAVQAKSIAVLAINQTVTDIIDEMGITCEDLETVTVSESGIITAINTNTINTNKLKNIITVRVQEEIGNIRNKEADIPLGTIIGGDLLSGQGPGIPVYISMTGNVNSEFESEFESGGINQTVHKLSVNISADITVVMPFASVNENVSTNILVGETVIVGTTPSGMLMSS